ncbi:hypothetical protein [Rhodococcus sp. NPDC047139]|uniref:hypothetical protein n=1 Tax=Rhodococcus sp. NPDC047139 TaxID=3155141 RepID=UPI00340779FB
MNTNNESPGATQIGEDIKSTPATTRAYMTDLEARGFTPVRHSFVQQHSLFASSSRKAPLAHLVAARRERELNAYLLLLMNFSQLEKRTEPLPATVWARAMSPREDDPLPEQAVSRIWKNLEEHKLIDRTRKWKRAHVLPRDESTTRKYTRPRPDAVADEERYREIYFILPSAYWTEGWHATLSLPARALLLIMLHGTSSAEDTYLPYAKAEDWYGISTKTAERGIVELLDTKLLKITRKEKVRADFAATGFTTRTYYTPTGHFSTTARKALQDQTKRESEARSSRRLRTSDDE